MSLFNEIFSWAFREAVSSSKKKVTQINNSGSNNYTDNSSTNIQNVNNSNSQDDDFWYIAGIVLLIVIACSPGIWIASGVHCFKLLSQKQCWGVSIVGSGLLFFLIKYLSHSAFKIYLGLCIVCSLLILSTHLFLHYPMPVRITMKMLGMENDIPMEYRTFAPEFKEQETEIILSATNINLLLGTWESTTSNLIFRKNGILTVDWFEHGKKHNKEKWRLSKNNVSFTIDNTPYEIIKFAANEFYYINSETNDTYPAYKK